MSVKYQQYINVKDGYDDVDEIVRDDDCEKGHDDDDDNDDNGDSDDDSDHNNAIVEDNDCDE